MPGPADGHRAERIEQKRNTLILSLSPPRERVRVRGIREQEEAETERMTELAPNTKNAPDAKESGHVTRVTDTSFEPQIMAFCCEH